MLNYTSNCPQLIITNDAHEVDARFIRHPATAWFLAPLAPLPTMRCGAGEARWAALGLPLHGQVPLDAFCCWGQVAPAANVLLTCCPAGTAACAPASL